MQQLTTESKKKCFKCGEEKFLSQFYKHPQMGDGHLNKCKDCTRSDVSDNYEINKENPEFILKERARGREKAKRLYSHVKRDPIVKKKSMAQYIKKYPEKDKAKSATSRIECPPGCERHHWSYNDEHLRDVIILPVSLHAKVHRYMTYIQKKKMYQTYEGTILDTREKHELFISKVADMF